MDMPIALRGRNKLGFTVMDAWHAIQEEDPAMGTRKDMNLIHCQGKEIWGPILKVHKI